MPSLNSTCVWCGSLEETVEHLFWDCQLAKRAWDFISSWWNIPKALFPGEPNTLARLVSFINTTLVNKVWRIVIAATLWSIWLSRNETAFANTRISRRSLEFLITTRVNKWAKTSLLIPFTMDLNWSVNPQGTIALYHYKSSHQYWQYKLENFDFVCDVDESWGLNSLGEFSGGIGGRMRNKAKDQIYVFAGPVKVRNSFEAEIEAIIHMVRSILHNGLELKCKSFAICADSTAALEQIRSGLKTYQSLAGPICGLLDPNRPVLSFHYVSRDLNENADSLAKAGLNKPYLYSYWAKLSLFS